MCLTFKRAALPVKTPANALLRKALLRSILRRNPEKRSEAYRQSLVDIKRLVDRFELHFPYTSNRPLWKAIQMLFRIHGCDIKHGGECYVLHPLEVAWFIYERFEISDPELLIAALLHDAIEDHPDELKLKKVKSIFGKRVAKILKAVTNPPKQKSGNITEAQRKHTRIRDYQAHVAAVIADDDIFIVKLADNYDNSSRLVTRSAADRQHFYYLANKYGALLPLYCQRLAASPGLIARSADFVSELRSLGPRLAELAKRWEFYAP
jgi:hypothetical protein